MVVTLGTGEILLKIGTNSGLTRAVMNLRIPSMPISYELVMVKFDLSVSKQVNLREINFNEISHCCTEGGQQLPTPELDSLRHLMWE